MLLLREQVRDLADMNLLLRRELTSRDRRLSSSETVETISEIEEPIPSISLSKSTKTGEK